VVICCRVPFETASEEKLPLLIGTGAAGPLPAYADGALYQRAAIVPSAYAVTDVLRRILAPPTDESINTTPAVIRYDAKACRTGARSHHQNLGKSRGRTTLLDITHSLSRLIVHGVRRAASLGVLSVLIPDPREAR
jgi:hypothetical protein